MRLIDRSGTGHSLLLGVVAAASLTAALLLFASAPAQAAFGVASFSAEASNEDGSVDLRAGSHPFAYDIDLSMRLDGEGEPEGTLRSLAVDLPFGLIGNPLAVPRCGMADFAGQAPRCPGATQVGIVHADLVSTGASVVPLYNLVPPSGYVAAFGFSAVGITGIELVSLRHDGGGTNVEVSLPSLPDVGIRSIAQTIWGVPADPGHDAERICFDSGGTRIEGCSAESEPAPLLTMPGSCAGPLRTTITVASGERPEVAESTSALSRDDAGNPRGLTGCGELSFEPALAVRSFSSASDSPTGLHVGLRVPVVEAAGERAAANLRNAVIRLPAGIAIDPSAANGLFACSAAQIGLVGPPGAVPVEFTADEAACPDAARIGTASIETPLLEAPLRGAVYLAEQSNNPFASLLALYVVLGDPVRGVGIKLAARVEADPRDGQSDRDLRRPPAAAVRGSGPRFPFRPGGDLQHSRHLRHLYIEVRPHALVGARGRRGDALRLLPNHHRARRHRLCGRRSAGGEPSRLRGRDHGPGCRSLQPPRSQAEA